MDLGDPDGALAWRVADGRIAYTPFYSGQVDILDLVDISDINCSALGSRYILGREIISRFKVTLEHGRRLIVEL